MATPILFRILPLGLALTDAIEGPTQGGNLVDFYGDGFQLPRAENGDSPTVEVLFDGVPSPRVDVIRSNFIRAIAPGSPLQRILTSGIATPEGPVDITIRNIDENGDPIPGEELVILAGYTYTRAGITSVDDSVLKYIDQQFVLRWRRDTIDNVSKGQHTEWDADTSTELNIISLASLPAIVLVGPDLPENTFYAVRERQEIELSDGTVALVDPPRTVDMEYDVVIITDSESQLMSLVQMARAFVKNTTFFTIDRCPTDPSLGTVKYEFDEKDFTATRQSRPNNSNIKSYTITVSIKGVDLGTAPGFGALAQGANEAVPLLNESPNISANAFES